MAGNANEAVNETLAMMDRLDEVLTVDEEAIRIARRAKMMYKERRANYFAGAPVLVVGTEDVRLMELKDRQKNALKDPKLKLNALQVEEILFRQELQHKRKKAKRDKAKQKRKNLRYNRARQR